MSVAGASDALSDEFSLVASQQAVVHDMTPDPFLAMNLGEEMQNQYLSDAQQRLENPELWKSNAAAEIRLLASTANPAAKVKLDKL